MRAKLLLIIFILNLIFSPLSLAAMEAQKDVFRISYNEGALLLKIDAPGFIADQESMEHDYLFATNEKNGMILTLYFQDAKGGSADICRDQKWDKMKELSLDVKKARNWKFKDMQFKDYLVVDEFDGAPFDQKHLLGCMAKADTWIVIHISKMNYKSKDRKLFTNLLRNINVADGTKIMKAIEEEKSKIPEIKNSKSFEYFIKGNEYFTNEDFKKAILYYRKAFNLEKKKSTFGEIEWHVLIDNFGMAYGITGDYKRAIDVFEYGIKYSPRYPMFYYNLACTYAEQDNLTKALRYLSKAYLYRNNNLVGEQLPDPYTDDSFKKFVDDKGFQRIADRINRSRK